MGQSNYQEFIEDIMLDILAATCLALAFYLRKPLPRLAHSKIRTQKTNKQAALKEDLANTREVTELLILSLSSGMTVPQAINTVAMESETLLADQLGRVFRNYQLGADLAIELNEIASKNQHWKFIARLLEQSWQQGATILENLAELNDYLLELERTTILRKVKRAGVMSVLPLGFCFLPAFGLLVVIPMIGSLITF